MNSRVGRGAVTRALAERDSLPASCRLTVMHCARVLLDLVLARLLPTPWDWLVPRICKSAFIVTFFPARLPVDRMKCSGIRYVDWIIVGTAGQWPAEGPLLSRNKGGDAAVYCKEGTGTA